MYGLHGDRPKPDDPLRGTVSREVVLGVARIEARRTGRLIPRNGDASTRLAGGFARRRGESGGCRGASGGALAAWGADRVLRFDPGWHRSEHGPDSCAAALADGGGRSAGVRLRRGRCSPRPGYGQGSCPQGRGKAGSRRSSRTARRRRRFRRWPGRGHPSRLRGQGPGPGAGPRRAGAALHPAQCLPGVRRAPREAAQVEHVAPSAGSEASAGGYRVVGFEEPPAGAALDVSEAAIIVSGGRGMKGPENWHLLADLRDAHG